MGELTKSRLEKYANGNIFIETGTWLGGTVFNAICSNMFNKIYSVELHEKLAANAIERFKENTTVTIHKGESPNFLQSICPTLVNPATFWLDAHASGGDLPGSPIYGNSPLIEELSAINLSPCKMHTIIIDDIRDCGQQGWPTKQELIDKLLSINNSYKFEYIDGYESLTDIDKYPNDILICSI